LPFIDTRFAFIAILPAESSNVRAIVRNMNPASFKKLLDSSRLTNLALHLPKFESEYETNLLDNLNNLGMGEALHSGADFSLMDKNRNKALSITGIRHKTYFKIDENGAEAAAVTGVTMAGISKIEDKSKLVFDRPFLYGIVDTKTGLPLFLGIMDNPAK
jgi:serine protease inhibitor